MKHTLGRQTVQSTTLDELLFTVPFTTIASAPVKICLEVRRPQSVKLASTMLSFSGPSAVVGTSNSTHITFTFATVRYSI